MLGSLKLMFKTYVPVALPANVENMALNCILTVPTARMQTVTDPADSGTVYTDEVAESYSKLTPLLAVREKDGMCLRFKVLIATSILCMHIIYMYL